jgi:hypothetical protein
LRSALHHEACAALGDVREHSLAAMQANGFAEVDRKYEVDHCARWQPKGFYLQEDTHG